MHYCSSAVTLLCNHRAEILSEVYLMQLNICNATTPGPPQMTKLETPRVGPEVCISRSREIWSYTADKHWTLFLPGGERLPVFNYCTMRSSGQQEHRSLTGEKRHFKDSGRGVGVGRRWPSTTREYAAEPGLTPASVCQRSVISIRCRVREL